MNSSIIMPPSGVWNKPDLYSLDDGVKSTILLESYGLVGKKNSFRAQQNGMQ